MSEKFSSGRINSSQKNKQTNNVYVLRQALKLREFHDSGVKSREDVDDFKK